MSRFNEAALFGKATRASTLTEIRSKNSNNEINLHIDRMLLHMLDLVMSCYLFEVSIFFLTQDP